MISFIVRLLVTGLAIWVSAQIVDGIDLVDRDSSGDTLQWLLVLAGVALIFTVISMVVKPLVSLLSLPLVILTLGLFMLVINALMLLLTSWVAGQLGLAFSVDGFWSALIGSVIITFVSWVLNVLLPKP